MRPAAHVVNIIPTLIIDPKGDMANLLLQFPDLKAADFEPWVDTDAARRKAKTARQLAGDTAKLWRTGIGEWDQDADRILDLAAYGRF